MAIIAINMKPTILTGYVIPLSAYIISQIKPKTIVVAAVIPKPVLFADVCMIINLFI